MFSLWKKVDALNQINRFLLANLAVMLVIIAGLTLALIKLPSQIEVWLSPAMMSSGGLIKAGEIPNEYVHGFASALIPTLNTWSKAGKQEFATNIQAFHYYFTPRHEQLMKQMLNAFYDAQLFERTQVASLYHFLEPGDIKRLSDKTWEVHLLLRITQRVNNKSPMVIADKIVDYHLRVVHVGLSKLLNPFQLALDGYTQPEHLVSDLLSNDSKGDKHAV